MDHRALLLSLRDLLASAQTLVQHMLTLEGVSDAVVTPPPNVPPGLPPPQAALPPGPAREASPVADAPGDAPAVSASDPAAGPARVVGAKPRRDGTAAKQALQAFWANLSPEDRAARIARMQGARRKKPKGA